jgi:hypothetical protein
VTRVWVVSLADCGPKRREDLGLKQDRTGNGDSFSFSAVRALKSPWLRALVRDCVPPIMLRWSRLDLPERPIPTELIWAKNRYDGSFDIDWSKINFNRIAIINLICTGRGCEDYLEIGCNTNECFDAIIAKNKIGVDPERGGTHRLTSDQFFSACGNRKFDIIFIDGWHTYEQARRDVINSLQHISIGGWIVLHDMFPRNWREEHVPVVFPVWLGDVWKVGFELAGSPDVDFKLLKIDHGVGVVRVLKENPSIPDLRTELQPKRFQYFYENIDRLPILDYENGRAWIESCLQQ